MTRRSNLAGLLGGILVFSASTWAAWTAQTQQPQKPEHPAPSSDAPTSSVDEPPEEDDAVKPKIYPFNPLESERNIRVGNFYMHKADYRGALNRYQEASKYNPNSAVAYLHIGLAEEKLKHKNRAKAAFERALQLEPDSKTGKEAKKKLSSLS